MTAVAAPGTRRAAILARLADRPDLTAYELRRLIGAASHIGDLLRSMELRAEVVSRTEPRPGQSRLVHVWRLAPSGTVPPPRTSEAAEIVARKRERDRITTAARRARARVPFAGAAALPDAACLGADPALFFPERDDTEAEAAAKAICAGCPVRVTCYERAVQNRECFGIFGGVNFEAMPRPRPAQRMSAGGVTIEPTIAPPRPAASFPRAQQQAGASSPQQGPGGPGR